MANERRRPPSGRDFEAYTRVTVEQQSTRQVALDFAVSQTRVCQIMARVGEYLLQVAPASVSEEDRGRQIYVAQQIAAEQVQFFIRQAHEAFERSIGKQTVVREVDVKGKPKRTTSTTKVNHGDLRCLDRAAKFALLGAKLPAANLAGLLPEEDEAVLAEADIAAAREREAEEAEMEAWSAAHPEEDCSPATGEEAGEEMADAENDDPNPHHDDTSGVLSDAEAAAFHAEIRASHPVQLREELLKSGHTEEEVDKFLRTPRGQELLLGYQELIRGLHAPREDVITRSVMTTN